MLEGTHNEAHMTLKVPFTMIWNNYHSSGYGFEILPWQPCIKICHFSSLLIFQFAIINLNILTDREDPDSCLVLLAP